MTNTIDPRALVARLTGYTPGPWDAVVDPRYGDLVVECDGIKLAYVNSAEDETFAPSASVASANARLIAFAPELHATLTAALDEIERLRETLTDIRDWRNECREYDNDMDHEPRDFDEEDVRMLELLASAALKGSDQ